MARIVITEFIDERVLPALQAKHDVLYDAKLVDDSARLLKEAASADALVVRNRTQVRGELLAALLPFFQRGRAFGTGEPEVGKVGGGGYGGQSIVGEDAAGSGEGVGLKEAVENAVVQLDVLDAGFRPTFERAAIAGATGGVLVDGELHFGGMGLGGG